MQDQVKTKKQSGNVFRSMTGMQKYKTSVKFKYVKYQESTG